MVNPCSDGGVVGVVAANRAWASKASKAASRAKGAHCRAVADRRAWATCAARRASSSSRRRRGRGLSGGGAQMRLQRQGCGSQVAMGCRSAVYHCLPVTRDSRGLFYCT